MAVGGDELVELGGNLIVVGDVEDADDVGELALDLGGEVAHGDDDVAAKVHEVIELAVRDVDAVAALGADLLDLGLEQHARADTGTADNQGVDHVVHLSRFGFSLGYERN